MRWWGWDGCGRASERGRRRCQVTDRGVGVHNGNNTHMGMDWDAMVFAKGEKKKKCGAKGRKPSG